VTAATAPLSGTPSPRLPDPAALFAARAHRLTALAAVADCDPFLAFLSRLAAGQGAASRALAIRRVGPALRGGRGHALDPARLAADPALVPALAEVLAAARERMLPARAAAAVAGLTDATEAALARLAASVLAGAIGEGELPAAAFVGAALQAVATSRAALLDPAALSPSASPGTCPACGAPPVAGIVEGDGGLRWLACGLCATTWHLARIHCATCGRNDAIGYRHLEGDPGARAETCDACRTYVKLFDVGKRPGADPLADDAATLALDVLLGEEGYARGGPNLLVPMGG
jgi:FdhE protein